MHTLCILFPSAETALPTMSSQHHFHNQTGLVAFQPDTCRPTLAFQVVYPQQSYKLYSAIGHRQMKFAKGNRYTQNLTATWQNRHPSPVAVHIAADVCQQTE